MATIITSHESGNMGLKPLHTARMLPMGELAPRPSSGSVSASTETATPCNAAAELIAQVTSFVESYASLNELFERSWNVKNNTLLTKSSSKREPIDVLHNQSLNSSIEIKRSHGPVFYDAYSMYSQTAHMGILDPSYDIFTSELGYGALVYKVKNRTAVITGDPLCPVHQFHHLLKEFRRKKQLKLAFMGVGQEFVEYAMSKDWTTMLFGRERVVNPLTNKVLRQLAGKRMMTQSRRLLDPKRVSLTADIYCPGRADRNSKMETEIQTLYDLWRMDRNSKNEDNAQAFVTVYDLFSDPDITLYVYIRDREGHMVGLAVLRSLGASNGFHLDPCIASPTAPSGVTDLLVILSMMLLRGAGLAYLSFGYEPFPEMGDISGQLGLRASMARWGYRHIIESVQVGGKAAYHNKFRPDETLTSNLYIVIPKGPFQIQQSTALMHVANIKLRRLLLPSPSNARSGVTNRNTREKNEQPSTTHEATTKRHHSHGTPL